MKKTKVLLSVTNDSNDFQIEQVKDAREAAERLGVELDVLYAQDNGVIQSEQLLRSFQFPTGAPPDVIMFEPAGSTTLPQVANAAAAKGIGWVVLSRDAEYITQLRSAFRIPAFVVTADHTEIGRIQGRQLSVLLPHGGIVLTILGPTQSKAASLRQTGLLETKPKNVQLITVKGHWSEESAQKAVRSWLSLSTSRTTDLAAVCAQDDSMAMGARKAFQESRQQIPSSWLQVPFLGCDGMPQTGQEWVRAGLLTATVLSPPTAPVALELIARFLKLGTMPPEHTLTEARPIPPLTKLTGKGRPADSV